MHRDITSTVGKRARRARRRRLSVEPLENRALLSMLESNLGGSLSQVSPPSTNVGAVASTDARSSHVPQPGDPDFVGPPDPNNSGDEGTRPHEPQQVTGMYLTDGAASDPGYDKAMSFDKVVQGQSDTCAFASTLSAVALSSFDLASGITLVSQQSPSDYLYDVRMFEPQADGSYKPILIPEDFNGTINSSDAKSTDPNEFWPTLYQRAYLQVESAIGRDYHFSVNAFEALTGMPTVFYTAAGFTQTVTPAFIENALNSGNPMTAGTVANSDPYHLDPAAGIIGDHFYAVVGIEIPASGATSGTYLTLRNPWGTDTTPLNFDKDGDGLLNAAEWVNFEHGLDGANDGIIRVSWSDFEKYFNNVNVGAITGPSIDHPQEPPPTFTNPNLGPFTAYEGQQLGPLDLSAVDSQGRTLTYHIQPGQPGVVGSNGQYTWTPLPTDLGTHFVTVVAQSNSLSAAFDTFEVDVLPVVPTVSAVIAAPTTISATGTDLLTLSAVGVAAEGAAVSGVTYWLDTPGAGVFDRDNDIFLGSATVATGWSWSGYIGGISPGTFNIFAVAEVDSNGLTLFGSAASTSITITPGPAYSVVAVPWIDQVQVSPDSSNNKTGLGATEDGSGNTRVFWNQSSSQFVREYDPFGHPLTAPVQLAGGTSQEAIVGLPDGSFDAAFFSGRMLEVQRYSAAAATVGSPIVVGPDPLSDASFTSGIQAAADANGDLVIVFTATDFGNYGTVAYVGALSAGGVATAPIALSLTTSDNQQAPTVALDASGAGVVAWVDRANGDTILARRVTSAGLSLGPQFTVYQDLSVASVSAAVDDQGDFTLAYEGLGGIHARQYGGDGTSDSGDFKVAATAPGDTQSGPRVAESGQGWTIIAWNDAQGGPAGTEPDAQVFDPKGNPLGTSFLVPNVVLPATLSGLAFGDNGKIAIAYNQEGLNDPSHLVTDFRLYRVDMAPVFAGPYQFTALLGSPVGTVVGTVQGTDPDGDSVLYTLQGNSPFAVDPNSGKITVADASALQSTSVTNYDLTILASDGNPNANVLPVTNVVISIIDKEPITLRPIPDRVADQGNDIVSVLGGSDTAGGSLTYSATAEPLLYWLERQYGLYEGQSGYNTNLRGGNEKYLFGKVSASGYNTGGQDSAYYVLPNGDL